MDIEAFILIGGRSSRFGSDKWVAMLGEKRVVDILIEAVTRALPGRRVTLVAGSDGQLPAGVSLDHVAVIFDLYPGRGPLGGIQAALAYARAPLALVLACDLPFASAELVEYIVNKTDDASDVVLPIQPDGRLQPLCAVYRRGTCLALFENVLRDDRPTPPLHRILEQLRCRSVAFDEIRHLPGSDRFFTNINTTSDLAAASKLLRG